MLSYHIQCKYTRANSQKNLFLRSIFRIIVKNGKNPENSGHSTGKYKRQKNSPRSLCAVPMHKYSFPADARKNAAGKTPAAQRKHSEVQDFRIARSALRIAITATPTSANTDIHTEAMPQAPSTRQMPLTASAKTKIGRAHV